MDREKVIKAYECCKNSFDRICEKCPYEKDCCHDGIPMFVIKKMVAMLKEQEPIAPVKVNRYMETDENGNWVLSETYDCGYCGGELHSKANYCHLCGRQVKWE